MILANHQILVSEGVFELVGYDDLEKQVESLGDYLKSVEVTPDNIGENKKLVAQVRKMTDALDRERIEFKKQYLKPVENLEGQVRKLTGIVKECEEVVRGQIRQIEEQERDEKEQRIHKIFTLRLRSYGNEELYPFSQFLQPKHLNKSYSLKKVEDDMVAWFEGRKRDIDLLENYADDKDIEGAVVLDRYLETGSIQVTMEQFNEFERIRKELKGGEAPKRAKRPTQKTAAIRVSIKDFEKACAILDAAGIEWSAD